MQKVAHNLPQPTEIKKYYKPSVNLVSLRYDYKYHNAEYFLQVVNNIEKLSQWTKVDTLSYCNNNYISLEIYKNIDEIKSPNYFAIEIFFQERSYCMTKFKV